MTEPGLALAQGQRPGAGVDRVTTALSFSRPAYGVVILQQVTRPSVTPRRPARPRHALDGPRVMAVQAALVGICTWVAGFTNQQLVELVGDLLRIPYGSRQPPRTCAG